MDICYYYHFYEIGKFPILENFSDNISGDNNKGDFVILYSKISQYVEDLYNLVNEYFPNDEYQMV